MNNVIWQPIDVGINAPNVSSILEPDGDNLIVHVINDEYWDTANVANIKIFTDMRLCRAVPNNYPEPDWNNAPEWAHWWAVEPDGIARWYAEQPSIEDAWWGEEPSSLFGHDGTVNLPIGCDWRMTLRKRPEVQE